MGRSGSSSQANQATSTSSTDNRIVNESGIVAQGSALDLSSYFSANTSNSSEINDFSTMQLTSTDSSDRSTKNSFSDSSDRSTKNSFSDSSDRSTNLANYDSSDRSSNTNLSTWESFTDARATNTWDSSSSTAGSYNTTLTADPEIAKAAFNFATNNDAMLGAGLDRMLGFASELTNKTQDNATGLASRFQDSVMQAFDSARTTTPGGIDNKTMIILGVAGAVAVAFAMKKGN